MIGTEVTGCSKFTVTGPGVRMGAAMGGAAMSGAAMGGAAMGGAAMSGAAMSGAAIRGAVAGLSAPSPIPYTVHRLAGPPGPGYSPG